MRIAVISTMGGSPWGGSEELWAAMAEEALANGHEVVLSTYRWPSIPPRIAQLQGRGARLLRRPFPVYRTPYRRMARRLIGRRASPFQELFDARPDVLLVSQGGTYDGVDLPEILEALNATGLPYVVVCQWGSDACGPDARQREAAREYFARAYRVAFVSLQNLRMAERQLAVPLPNGVVVRNPVNLTDLSVVPWPPEDLVCMASVGRLDVSCKGQDILFESLASAAWREREWRLRLYGEGPDREYLEELARFYGIAGRVEFRGQVAGIRAVWADNHLLVMPSRSEGTPLALVEAMLCGRPSAVSDVGGATEWVEEARTGFIAAAPTAGAFQAALERAWRLRADWQRIGLQAHEDGLEKFDATPGRSLLRLLADAAGAGRAVTPGSSVAPLRGTASEQVEIPHAFRS